MVEYAPHKKERSENLNKTLKTAFVSTIPVMTGYLVLGFGFGIVMNSSGFDWWAALAMSLFIYAGSMQYVAIGLMTGGASLITVALTTLMVNARHLFYGISMLDRYKNTGKNKPYLIFALTDETYSLVCTDNPTIAPEQRNNYYFLVSILDQLYWVGGTLLGVAVGSLINFNSEGIDFALTALFVTVFVDQWLSSKKHGPALIGLGVSVLCLVIFGSDSFLIPTMLGIAVLLCIMKEGDGND
ncbi:MAG: AzlC family ABC transporter permease [Oscillospiraceae bacterium]|nr:AzlC family ABC transporter permease [Oscillospiraceae bacterium]